MRLGLVGCGRITERGYVPAAAAAEGVEIAALADPNPERLGRCQELWAQRGGAAQGFDGLRALLEGASVDLLVVAAPLEHHLPLAAEAAEAGVRSLVEKPPAPDLATAQQLAALDPEPFLAFNRRFLQGLELRKAIPAEGWLELDLELRFQRDAWGAHEARDEALLDAGIHLIDLACHLSGAAPIAVREAEIEPERARLELELARGRARIRCATDRSHREAIVVRDRAGKVLAQSNWGGLRSRIAAAVGGQDPLALSLQRQLEALRDGSSLLATAADGATAMAIVEAARRSAGLGGSEVTVAPLGASL
jgi:predicted dehydrogenase